jgi:hypothetical protein
MYIPRTWDTFIDRTHKKITHSTSLILLPPPAYRPTMVRDNSKVVGGAAIRSVSTRKTGGDASVIGDGYVGADDAGGLARFGPLGTQLRMGLPSSLDRVRVLGSKALAADCAVRVCKGRHGGIARAEAVHALVLAVV